jgi:polyphosphate kinase
VRKKIPKLKKRRYEELLAPLELELSRLARWLRWSGRRMVVVLEGRDTAGKGGTIGAIAARMNPRQFRIVALGTPTERERTAWYFQRYAAHLPAAGELVLFDRSWYNRAGVEHVMGFCTKAEYRRFLEQAPIFERMLVDDGILLYKYWLAVDQHEQEQRFAERAADPVKRWKLSPVDLEARRLYAAYGRARDAMFEATHKKHAPWYVVDFNEQRRGRLNLIRHLLDQVPDVSVEEPPVELPPLTGRLKREHYRGPVRPIRNRY